MTDETGTAATILPPSRSMSNCSINVASSPVHWQELMCELNRRLNRKPPACDAELGEIDIIGVADLTVTRVRSNSRGIGQSAKEAADRAQVSNDLLALMVCGGEAALSQGGRRTVLREGDVAFHDCSRPYDLRFASPHHTLLALRMPRKLLESQVDNLDELTARALPRDAGTTGLLLSMARTVHYQPVPPEAAKAVADALTNVAAAALRSIPGSQACTASNLRSHHLRRIKAHVRENLHDPVLSVSSIADALGISADHVSRLFRNEPLSLSRMIWQQRLAACKRDLANDRLASRSATDIAFSWGFSSAAHFSRSFRTRYGMSPSKWRMQQRRMT
jgi:AraC-like DNA-binding protein